MTPPKETIKGLKVLVITDKGTFEAAISENDKYRIWKILDEKKITLTKPKK